jgi:acetyltransferase-like isoleucine patch superfamily enzyme
MGNKNFLAEKLKDLPLSSILFDQFEAVALWLFSNFPGVPGFFLRNAICKILFKKKNGMVWIQPNVTFVFTNNIEVGIQLGVNSGCYLNGRGGLKIGNYVLLGPNVILSSGVHPIEGRTPPIFARPTIPKQITIEDDVWIGANSVIMPGVTLKRGTVVGANTVITKDTEPFGVYVGCPGKKIRERQ